LDLDLVGGLFGQLELLNEFDVLENVTFRVGQRLQQVGLKLLELDLEVVLLGDQLLLLLSQVGALFLHYHCQKLIFETCFCHSEVDESTLSLNFRRIVGVGELRVHDKLEVLMKRQVSISHLDELALSFLMIALP